MANVISLNQEVILKIDQGTTVQNIPLPSIGRY